MKKVGKTLVSSVQRKRMYKAKKMWVIAGVVGLAFGGVTLSDFVSVDQNGVHITQRTAEAAAVDSQIFSDVDTTADVTEPLPANQATNVNFTVTGSGVADVAAVNTGSREVALQVPAGTDITANGPISVDVAVTGGLGTILDPIVNGLQGVLNVIDNPVTKLLVGSSVVDNLNATLDNLKNGAITAQYTIDPSEATVTTLPDGSQYLAVNIDGGLGTALSQTLSGTLSDLLDTLSSINLLGIVNLDPVLSPLVDNLLTPLISELTTGTGDTVNQLVDLSVLGSTSVTIPTQVTPDGTQDSVSVKGAIARSELINVDLFANSAGTTPLQVDTTGADLATAKADATAAIDAMKYLTDEEKADYKQQVADATTTDAIDTVVADATEQNLANAKDWATDEINGLTNLDDAGKQTYLDQLPGATTVEAVEQIVEDARNATSTDLTTEKADATAAIDAMKYLTDEEKVDYKQQVADATTADAIDAIVTDATAKNLANAKDWATDEINGLTNLDDAGKQTYTDQLPDAATVEAVEQIVEDARNATGTDLTDAKADATAAIDAMKYLTDEEKATYKQQVTDATTADAIDAIVTDATAQNLANAKDWATTEIGGLTNLDDAGKQTYLDQVTNAATVEEVEQIVANAKAATENPDDGGTTPGDGGTTPGDGGTTPGDGGTTPGDGGTTPGDGGTTPGDSGTTPGGDGTTPGGDGTTPGGDGTTPGGDGTTPGDGGTTPGDGTTPGGDGTTPGDGGTTSGNGDSAPVATDVIAPTGDTGAAPATLENADVAGANNGGATGAVPASDNAGIPAVASTDGSTNGGNSTDASTSAVPTDSTPVAMNNNGVGTDSTPTGGSLAYTADTSLQDAKNAANGDVDKMKGLSDAEKQGYKDRINSATTPDEVKAILSDAQNQNDSQIKADKLADKKKAAIAEINKMKHLSDEQKRDFIDRVDDARTVNGVDRILNQAREQNVEKEVADAPESESAFNIWPYIIALLLGSTAILAWVNRGNSND
ncbi:adhesive domain-containing protein [Weissella cibaria]